MLGQSLGGAAAATGGTYSSSASEVTQISDGGHSTLCVCVCVCVCVCGGPPYTQRVRTCPACLAEHFYDTVGAAEVGAVIGCEG